MVFPPTNVVHPWCPRFILRDSSFCSFGSRFSCLPSCFLVLFSWVFYNSENWPWTLSNLLGILWLVQQGNPESEKFLLVDSRIRENFTCGLWNTAQGIRNLTNDWNQKSRFHRQRLESSTWNTNSTGVESRIQDCLGFSYIWRTTVLCAPSDKMDSKANLITNVMCHNWIALNKIFYFISFRIMAFFFLTLHIWH